MQNRYSLENRVQELFAHRLNVDVPSTDTDVIETGLVDSLMFVELLAQLEEVFGVSVALDDLEIDNFRSISRIARFLVEKNSALQDHDRGGQPRLVTEAEMQPADPATLGLRSSAA